MTKLVSVFFFQAIVMCLHLEVREKNKYMTVVGVCPRIGEKKNTKKNPKKHHNPKTQSSFFMFSHFW